MWSLVYPATVPQSVFLCYDAGEQNDIVVTRVPNSAAGADELMGVSFVLYVS